MRKIFIKIPALVFILCLAAQISFSQENAPFSLDNSPLPAPTSPVMDYAGVIDPATKERIENKIIEFQKTSNPSVELAVAVVETTGDRPIFDYSLAVARGWGIGSREDDNPGALLFIAVKDREYFTQVSRNLEDELPDGLVGSLQRQNLVPEFKRGNYSKGIEDTIDAYIRTIKAKQAGEEIPVRQNEDAPEFDNFGGSSSGGGCSGFFICLIIIGIIIFIIISNSGGGGGGGGRGGRRRGKTSNSDMAGDILSGILTGIVLGGSSGGSSSGGSSWGGGSSGGDWGGFGGGGDFGGGGAGGGW